MRSTYKIGDAKGDLKALNDFLVELGETIVNKQAPYQKLEELMEDSEFSRLMTNIGFFQVEGNKYLAEIYAGKAKHFEQKVGK